MLLADYYLERWTLHLVTFAGSIEMALKLYWLELLLSVIHFREA
jgi:hypothetical protein